MKGLKTLFYLLLIGGALYLLFRPPPPHLKVGQLAPDFTLTGSNSEKITLSELPGEVVLVHFWVSWCPPCREELPSLSRLAGRLSDKGVKVLAVAVDSDRDALKKYLKGKDFAFTVLFDSGEEVADLYGALGLPETYIVDRDRILAKYLDGPYNWDSGQLDNYLISLVK